MAVCRGFWNSWLVMKRSLITKYIGDPNHKYGLLKRITDWKKDFESETSEDRLAVQLCIENYGHNSDKTRVKLAEFQFMYDIDEELEKLHQEVSLWNDPSEDEKQEEHENFEDLEMPTDLKEPKDLEEPQNLEQREKQLERMREKFSIEFAACPLDFAHYDRKKQELEAAEAALTADKARTAVDTVSASSKKRKL